LIEIMVVIGLLSVIVLGLMAMFTQTQRAFRLGMTQTDVLESGRIGTELLVRELEQATPGYVSVSNLTPNFYVEQRNAANVSLQTLPGNPGLSRTNAMQDVFFLTHENQTWKGIGYFVRTNSAINGSFGPLEPCIATKRIIPPLNSV